MLHLSTRRFCSDSRDQLRCASPHSPYALGCIPPSSGLARFFQMITKEQRIEAMKGVLASLFASQRTLKSLAPNFKWAGLGNLLGDYGEFIAIEAYNLQQAPRGAHGYDAISADGKKVQVKANYAASQIGFPGESNRLLSLKIYLNGDSPEIYY